MKKIFLLISTSSFVALTGCETTSSGTSDYYNKGFNDPWYYGDYEDHRMIATPPRGNAIEPWDSAVRAAPELPSAPRPIR